MFEREIALNQFLLAGLRKISADIPQERMYDRAPGNGHPPVWLWGHLAITGEFGLRYVGIPVAHRDWLRVFGPGSSDDVQPDAGYSKAGFLQLIEETYPRLQELVRQADPELLAKPHGAAILSGTPIQTVGDILAHLLTSHFSFHQAQLSGWRRAAGLAHLF